MSKQTSAGILLAKQLKLMQKEDHIEGISVGLVDDNNLFEWEVMLMINDEDRLYGGESSVLVEELEHAARQWRSMSARLDEPQQLCHDTYPLRLDRIRKRFVGREANVACYRRFLQGTAFLSQGLSSSTTKDEVRDSNMAP